MKKLSYVEIVEYLQDSKNQDKNDSIIYYNNSYHNPRDFDTVSFVTKFGIDPVLGEITHKEKHAGYDAGSNYWDILHFVDHDVYIKFSGYYSSYEGVTYPEDMASICRNVTPKEVMVTQYIDI